MKLHFPQSVLSLDDILNGKINQKKFSQSESYILNFIKQWYSDVDVFEFQTSGSTGKPKKIHLTRQQLSYSAESTLKFLFDKRSIERLLLCIDPRFIGGTQVIVRALVANADMHILPPSSTVSHNENTHFDLVSMVPLQLLEELKQRDAFHKISTVLIGGANLDAKTEEQLLKIQDVRFFHTFGMTETASHIGLRKLGSSHYAPIGDVIVTVDDRGCLKLKGSVTRDKWIQTNDVVELTNEGFRWLGRADWVINTGGLKVHPENLEERIKSTFPQHQIVITSIPDTRLGDKVVLVGETPLLDHLRNTSILTQYELPKAEFLIEDWPLTPSGKLDRLAIKEWVKKYARHSL